MLMPKTRDRVASILRRRPDKPARPDKTARPFTGLHVTPPVIIAAVPLAAVAVIAGIVSYSHIVALGVRAYQGQADAHLLPFVVDGLIVGGSVILLAGSWLGWLGVVPGVAGTLYANLESGLPHGALAATVATWPAIAFTVATFMLERFVASQARQFRAAKADTPPGFVTLDSADLDVTESVDVDDTRDVETPDNEADSGSPDDAQAPDKNDDEDPTRKRRQRRRRQGPKVSKRAQAAALIRDNPGLNDSQIADRLGIHPRTVSRARELVDTAREAEDSRKPAGAS